MDKICIKCGKRLARPDPSMPDDNTKSFVTDDHGNITLVDRGAAGFRTEQSRNVTRVRAKQKDTYTCRDCKTRVR
jgi:hypothetical protein